MTYEVDKIRVKNNLVAINEYLIIIEEKLPYLPKKKFSEKLNSKEKFEFDTIFLRPPIKGGLLYYY